MSKMKEYYHNEINCIDDDYFQLMSDREWEQAIEDERQRLVDMYGNTVMAKLKLSEFLNKNGEL